MAKQAQKYFGVLEDYSLNCWLLTQPANLQRKRAVASARLACADTGVHPGSRKSVLHAMLARFGADIELEAW
jgi:hypothetical protein